MNHRIKPNEDQPIDDKPIDDKLERLQHLRESEGAVAVQVVIGDGGFGVAAPDIDIDNLQPHRQVLLLEALSMLSLAIDKGPDIDTLEDGPIKTAAIVALRRDEQLMQLMGGISIERAVKGQA